MSLSAMIEHLEVFCLCAWA